MSQSVILEKLARFRTIGARNSAEVLDLGDRVISGGASLGDQEWAVREQVAIAALDLGQIEKAEAQIQILLKRFPKSPRIAVLRGLRLEAIGDYDAAEKLYMALLGLGGQGKGKGKGKASNGGIWEGESDETFITAHQRLITLGLYKPLEPSTPVSTTPTPQNIARTIPFLVKYLDTFHTDAEGWSLLADLYLVLSGWEQIDDTFAQGQIVRKYFPESGSAQSTGTQKSKGDQYLQQAMTCIAHRMTLEPWDWMVTTRYGEMALLFGDVPLAYKTFLRAIEMATNPTDALVQETPIKAGSETLSDIVEVLRTGGWKSRPWWNLKLCTTYLQSGRYEEGSATLSSSPPEYVEAIDRLVEQKLQEIVGSQAVQAWTRLTSV